MRRQIDFLRRRIWRVGRPRTRRLALVLAAVILVAVLLPARRTAQHRTPPPSYPVHRDLNVTEREDPTAVWACEPAGVLGGPCACVADFHAFLTAAAPFARPISADDLQRVLTAPPGPPRTVPPAQVPRLIADALHLDFLLDGLDARPLEVTRISTEPTAHGREETLLFTDSYIGTFKVMLRIPDRGAGPFPAIVAMHGHPGSAEGVMGGNHMGEWVNRRGFAIIAPTMRAMCADRDEHEISLALLRQGFTLQSLRVYAAALCLKYLRYRGDVDGQCVAVSGHCGGSATATLTAWLPLGFRALIYDQTSVYRRYGVAQLIDEDVPGLFDYDQSINDYKNLPIPSISFFGDFDRTFDSILDFLDVVMPPASPQR